MKKSITIRKRLEELRTKWSEEKAENKRNVAKFTEAISTLEDELECATDADEFAKSSKIRDELQRKLSFYEVQRKNFKHQLDEDEYMNMRRELDDENKKLKEEQSKKAKKLFEELILELENYNREVIELEKLRNDLAQMSGKSTTMIKSTYIRELSDLEQGKRFEDHFSSFLDFWEQRKGKLMHFDMQMRKKS